MSVRALLTAVVVLVGCGTPTPTGRAPASPGTAEAATLPPPAPPASPSPSAPLAVRRQRLLEAATIALPPGIAAESLPDPAAPGARVLQQYCTQCHALPSPAMHGAMDWPAVTRRMWVRIDMMAGDLGLRVPSTAERAELLAYLQGHALPVAGSLPPGVGRDLFATACSRCHVLPDPRMHSPPDWPVVVLRMTENMQRMKMQQISRADASQILGYLQTVSAVVRR